jgi:glycosyltransferase involved in cell wall biosynthesis
MGGVEGHDWGDGLTEGPLVSVVIPTRDRCRRLGVSLQSARTQRDVRLEVVVVDDGSQDDTAQVVANLGDPRVRLIRSVSPAGESGARNRGIAEAHGDWVAFLDDDDVWSPDKLQRQLAVLLETGRQWAYGGEVMVDAELHVLYGAPPPLPEEVVRALPRYNSVPAGASNVIVSASLLSHVGPFDPGLKRTADWDMWLRLARAGPPACVCEPLVGICIHPGNMSRDMRTMFRELDIIARRYGIPVDRARHYRWAAWGALADQHRWNAARLYGRAIAAGDVFSVGRAAVALVRPSGARIQSDQGSPWIAQARAWIDELAHDVEQSALHGADGHD